MQPARRARPGQQPLPQERRQVLRRRRPRVLRLLLHGPGRARVRGGGEGQGQGRGGGGQRADPGQEG